MKTITIILIAVFFLLIAARAIWIAHRHRITVMCIDPDRVECEYERKKYDEFIAHTEEAAHTSEKEQYREAFQAFIESVDPESPDQAMVFDKSNNMVLISGAIMARIYAGDMALKKRVCEFVEQYPDCKVLVGNFGFKAAE